MYDLTGPLITALVTPFTDDGEHLAPDRLARLIAHCTATGTTCLLLGGTTGEGPALTEEEFRALLHHARQYAPAGIPLMANVGTNSTRTSVARAIAAAELGADCLLVVCPYYNKPPQAGLIAHFETVAAATDLPLMIYNIPGRTAVNMLPATAGTLAERCPTIQGIKEASGDLEQMRQVIRAIEATGRTDCQLWSGDDGLTAQVMALGGVGVVSVISQVAGAALARLIGAAQMRDHATADAIQRELEPLVQAAFVTTNPIGIKTMLQVIGLDMGPVRLPLVPPSEGEVAVLRDAVAAAQAAGLIPG